MLRVVSQPASVVSVKMVHDQRLPLITLGVDPTRRSARAYFFATSMSKTFDSPEYLCKKCAVKIGRGKRQEHVRLKHRKELRVLWFPDGTEGPVKRSSSDETWHCPRCHVSCGPDPEVLIVRRTAPS